MRHNIGVLKGYLLPLREAFTTGIVLRWALGTLECKGDILMVATSNSLDLWNYQIKISKSSKTRLYSEPYFKEVIFHGQILVNKKVGNTTKLNKTSILECLFSTAWSCMIGILINFYTKHLAYDVSSTCKAGKTNKSRSQLSCSVFDIKSILTVRQRFRRI